MGPSFPGGKEVFIINTSWFTSEASLPVLLTALTHSTAAFALVPGEVEALKPKKDSVKKRKSRAYQDFCLCYFPRGTSAFEKSNNSSFYFSKQSFHSVNTLVLLVMPQASGYKS